MELPNMQFAASESYRYGFNGKENDREWGTASLTQDYGFRLYNPAIAKFLSVDPLAPEYPWNSTYAFAENDVIRSIDLEGAEKYVTISFGHDLVYRGDLLRLITAKSLKKSQRVIHKAYAIENNKAYKIQGEPYNLGVQLIAELQEASTDDFLEGEGLGIHFLALFSHGAPGNIFEEGEITIEQMQEGYPNDDTYSQDLASTLKSEIEVGNIKFTSKAVVYVGACNFGTDEYDQDGKKTAESYAQQIADVLPEGAIVIAMRGDGVGVKKENLKNMIYEPAGHPEKNHPNTQKFYIFQKGKTPIPLDENVDVIDMYKKAIENEKTIEKK